MGVVRLAALMRDIVISHVKDDMIGRQYISEMLECKGSCDKLEAHQASMMELSVVATQI